MLKANALLFLPPEDLAKLDSEVRAVIAQAVKREMALDDFDAPDSAASPPQRFPSEEELLKAHGLTQLQPYQESPDGQVIAVTAYPRFKPQDITQARALMEMVDAIPKSAAYEIMVTATDLVCASM